MDIPAEVLVIEDNTIDGMFVARTLRDSNARAHVQVIDSCEQALMILRSTDDPIHEHLHHLRLIILDLKHRGMSGFDFLKIVRADQRFRNIPIIVFSDTKSEHDRTLAMNLGANDFCVKSIDLKHFLASIRSISETWLRQTPSANAHA